MIGEVFILNVIIVRIRDEGMRSTVYKLFSNRFREDGNVICFEIHDCKDAQ